MDGPSSDSVERPTSAHDLAEIHRVLGEVAQEVLSRNPWLCRQELINEGWVWILHRWKYYDRSRGDVAGFVAHIARNHLYEMAARTCPHAAYRKGRRKVAVKIAHIGSYDAAMAAGGSNSKEMVSYGLTTDIINHRAINRTTNQASLRPDDCLDRVEWFDKAKHLLAVAANSDEEGIELLLRLAVIDSEYAIAELKKLTKRIKALRAYHETHGSRRGDSAA